MDTIRVQASGSTLPDYKINHPTESPFRKHNIQFHAGTEGNHRYLRDFSRAGITRFVEDNQPKGKSIDPNEVYAFLQAIAQDPEKFKDMVFDLGDPELGLREDDGVKAAYFKEDFTLKFDKKFYNKGDSKPQIAFVDVKDGHFDRKTSEVLEKSLAKADESLKEAFSEQKKIAEKIGDHAYPELERIEKELADTTPALAQAKTDLAKYQEQLKGKESTSDEARELRRQIRGTKLEITELEKRQNDLKGELDKDRSGFFESRTSYADLQKAQQKVKAAQQKRDAAKAHLHEHQHPKPVGPTAAEQKPVTDPKATEKPAVNTAAFLEKNSRARLSVLYGAAAADQKTYLASVTKSEEVQALLEETTKIIAANKSSMGTVDTQSEQRIAAYEAIRQQLVARQTELAAGATPPTTDPTKPTVDAVSGASAVVKPEEKPTQTGTVADASKTPGDATGTAVVPEQPKPVTEAASGSADFKTLDAKAQFDLLMAADASALETMLRSLTKVQRDAIAIYAQQMVDGFVAKYGASITTSTTSSTATAVSGGEANTATATTATSTSSVTVTTEVQAQYTRARLIVDLIAKINAEETGGQVAAPQETTPTVTVNETAQVIEYNFTGHKTAREIARELAKGNELATTDFIKQILASPAYQQLFSQAGDASKWPDADLNPTGQLMKIVLNRSVSSEDSRTAVINAGKAAAAKNQPTKTPPPKKTE